MDLYLDADRFLCFFRLLCKCGERIVCSSDVLWQGFVFCIMYLVFKLDLLGVVWSGVLEVNRDVDLSLHVRHAVVFFCDLAIEIWSVVHIHLKWNIITKSLMLLL